MFAHAVQADWKNDTFEVQKEKDIEKSHAAKSIKGERENGSKVEVRWKLGEWNEFKFQGKLKDGIIETK